jgi:hypothetical protein
LIGGSSGSGAAAGVEIDDEEDADDRDDDVCAPKLGLGNPALKAADSSLGFNSLHDQTSSQMGQKK